MDYNFLFTRDQQEELAKFYGLDLEGMCDFEIGEMLDRAIDDLIYGK